MKRKLDEHDVPTLVDTKDASKKLSSFNSLGLEARLLQAVAQQNFSIPTLVQCKAIPLILEGKDILGTMQQVSERNSHVLIRSFQLDPRPALARLLHTFSQFSNQSCKKHMFVIF